ncbi:MAG TPA: serine protease [Planctomycetia bacterium]|nr:serine protease [Planctomycetia bacterium]
MVAALFFLALHPSNFTLPQDAGSTVYEKALKSTAWIYAPQSATTAAYGTGTLIDEKRRLVLTNYHVVGSAQTVMAMFPLYRKGVLVAERGEYRRAMKDHGIKGKVVARDQARDLALIQLEKAPLGFKALPLAAKPVVPGQSIHSLGNPGDSGALWVYTPGRVRQVYQKRWQSQAAGRTLSFQARVIETDSATNSGDSGGPLVNDDGELVGVTQGGSASARLLSLFIDLTEVKTFLKTHGAASESDAEPPPPPRKEPLIVRDGGGFFSTEAKEKADRRLAEMFRRYGKDVLIVTLDRSPDGRAEIPSAEREQYFFTHAGREAKAAGIRTFVLLICRQPSYYVIRYSQHAKEIFPPDAERELLGKVREKLLANDYDPVLDIVLDFAESKLAAAKK